MASRARGRRRIDADGAWKRVLSEMLAEFVAFTLPELHAAIDWRREPIFLEQELRPVLRRAASGRRVVDLVVQVWLHDGATTWLLVHIEVQGRVETDFAERMFAYAALLYLRFRDKRARLPGQPPPPNGLVGIAVLTDNTPNWQTGPFAWGWGEYGVRYHFRTLKLADWRDRALALVGDNRPFAWVIRTALTVQMAGRAEEAQAEVRRDIGRQLLAARRAGRLDAVHAFAIYTFLDTLGGLSDALAEAIDQDIALTEEGAVQEVMSRYERRATERGMQRGLEQGLEQGLQQGLQQGRQQGLQQGETEGILATVRVLLGQRQIATNEAVEARIVALDRDDLLRLAAATLEFRDTADLTRWLERHAAPR